MVADAMLPAIRKAIQQNELGNASPYRLSFAQLGVSGASFGIFQGDTNVNHTARDVLARALQDAGAPAATISRIMAAVCRPCPDGNPLSRSDTRLANNALDSPAGRELVDAMDSRLLEIVLGELDTCVAAAKSRGHTIAAAAQLYVALWVNMTGAPDILNKWLSGTSEVGLAPPVGPVVTSQNIQNYLHACTFFRMHPRNFVHMQDSVNAALNLLPPTSPA
jgi:hypothetical protein